MLGALSLLVAAAVGGCDATQESVRSHAIGNAENGAALIQRNGCGSCHRVPGVSTASGRIGPPLDYWSRRSYIAGELPNTPDNLVRWIVDPQAIEPGTAMPALGLSESDARDVAAFLYTLD
jgi:cytochrome c2